LYRRRLACLLNLCRQDGGDTIPPKAVKFNEGIIMAKQTEKKQTFEQALRELEKIVEKVEQGEIGLEESIDKYAQGMQLIKHCRDILDQAEKRIETINKEAQPKTENDC